MPELKMRKEDTPSNLLDVEDAATFLGVPKSSIYKMTMRRELRFIKLGRLVKFRMRDLQNFVHQNTIEVGEFEA